MDKSCLRRGDVGSSRSTTPANAPHFFKIILTSVAENPKLRIPRKFVIKHGNNLANFVFLKVPRGTLWQVELVSSDEDVWICNGWTEFAEYYSIRFGHFLVFRYEGSSTFQVLIFDRSASEIEYPLSSSTHGGETNRKFNAETEDNENECVEKLVEDFPEKLLMREEMARRKDIKNAACVEILDDSPARQIKRMREAIPEQTFPCCEIKRTTPTCKPEAFSLGFQCRGIQANGLKLPNLQTEVNLHSLAQGIKEKCSGGASTSLRDLQSCRIHDRKQSSAAKGKFGALERARAFKCRKPFFRIHVKPSHVSNKYNLQIPSHFSKKYFGRQKNIVILQAVNGRKWSVKSCCSPSSGKRRLCWSSFAQDNKLKVGDACVFELLNGVELLLNVTIFGAEEYPFTATHVGLPSRNTTAERKDTQVDNSVEILEDFPTDQTRREEITERDKIEKDVSIETLYGCTKCQNRRKPASYREDMEKDASVKISKNHTTGGRRKREAISVPQDFPSCEMMRTNLTTEKEKTSNQQSFLPQSIGTRTNGLQLPNLKTGLEPDHLAQELKRFSRGPSIARQHQQSQLHDKKLSATANGKIRALQSARAFKSKKPFFMLCLRSSHVSPTSYGLHIPLHFRKQYLSGQQQDVILQVQDGKTWSFKLYCYPSSGKLRLAWLPFVLENKLKVGDVCVFELIKRVEPCLKVMIFRAADHQSASETEYPVSTTHCRESIINLTTEAEEDIETDDSVEILQDLSTKQTREEIHRTRKPTSFRKDVEKDVSVGILDDSQTRRMRRREVMPVADSPSREMLKTNPTCKMKKTSNPEAFLPDFQYGGAQMNGVNLPNVEIDRKPQCLAQRIRKEIDGGMSTSQRYQQSHIPDAKQSAVSVGKLKVLEIAKAFKSTNPFFMVYMHPSYVSRKSTLSIPVDFAKKHLGQEQTNFILQVTDGTTWSVKCYCVASNGKRMLNWLSFVRDNKLKVGDVCVFEMISCGQPLLNVKIFQAVECQSSSKKEHPFSATYGGQPSINPNAEIADSVDSLDHFRANQIKMDMIPESKKLEKKIWDGCPGCQKTRKPTTYRADEEDVPLEILDDPPARRSKRLRGTISAGIQTDGDVKPNCLAGEVKKVYNGGQSIALGHLQPEVADIKQLEAPRRKSRRLLSARVFQS